MADISEFYAYSGGMIEAAPAMDFQGVDQQTGQTRPVHLDNRIVVTFGRQRVTLNGSMVKALVKVYADNAEFRDWCTRCK